MSIKTLIYNSIVKSNSDVQKEYERYVIEHIEEHQEKRMKHWKILWKLIWHYKVKKLEEPLIYVEKRQNIVSESESKDLNLMSDYDLIKNSLYFDSQWYLNTYKDVRENKIDPIKHYLNVGWKEFRRPGPSFSTLLYLNRYADVSQMGINPLLHYEKIGKNEKRTSSYKALYKTISKEINIIEKSKFFDAMWYQKKYLSNNLSCEKPSIHYFCIGCYMGYDPSPAFSTKLYRKEFPEVKNLPYLLHYETYSKSHGKGYFNLSTSYYNNKNLYLQILKTMLEAIYKIQKENEKIRILLISHTLNLTGAPRVLFEMARVLKKKGFYPVIMTINEGPLYSEIEKEGIPVVVSRNYEDPDLADNIRVFAQNFDFMVFSTVEALKFAHVFRHTKAYKIAWVHEGNETLKLVSQKQKERINLMDEIYTGSLYCNKFFLPYIKDVSKLNVLYYGVDDAEIRYLKQENKAKSDKVIFIIAGTIGFRKGHHVLVEAINNLKQDILDKLEIWIVGSVIDREVGEEVIRLAEVHSEIKLWGQVENNKLIELINKADVLLCPSLDDPLPVVVTDALILSKPVVVTDMVGTAHFIENKKNGFVIKHNSAEELENVIKYIMADVPNISEIGERGNRIYKDYLSYEAFEKNVSYIFDEKKSSKYKNEESRTITNCVEFLNIEIEHSGYTFIFSCDTDNELCILNEGKIYNERDVFEKKWISLNQYLNKESKRIAIISMEKSSLIGNRLMVASKSFDTINLKIGEYTWLSLNHLAKEDFCIWFNENILSFITSSEYYSRVINNKMISESEKRLVKQAKNIREYQYNLYCETRDNMNDNAYMLFLRDLKTNKNAYFLTTESRYNSEKNAFIKEHLLILNTPKAKEYMLKAQRIISSWYAPPIYGYKRMLLLYPFLNLNYIFVPHGISYDKDSFYLNSAIWGEFTETICCSNLEKQYFEETNGYKNVKVLGYPRMDKWMCHSLNEDMILVFPSWRDKIDEHYVNTIASVCKAISEALPKKKLIYFAHPSIEYQDFLHISEFLKKVSNQIVIGKCSENDTFNKYFAEAKYLLTDYSSVAYDFAYKEGIPMYYKPFVDEAVHYHTNELFEKHNCGIQCKDIQAVIEVLQGECSLTELEERRTTFFEFFDTNNTERVYKEILENT